MRGTSLIGRGGAAVDPFLSNVIFQSHCESWGQSGNGIGSFQQYNSYSAISTAQKKFGSASATIIPGQPNPGSSPFPCIGQMLPKAGTNFAFGTGDFTIEMWFYKPSSAPLATLMDWRDGVSAGRPGMFMHSSNKLSFAIDSTYIIYTNVSFSNDVWNHVAVSQNSQFAKMHLNGVLIGVGNQGQSLTVGTPPRIGGTEHQYYPMSESFADAIRITKGIGRYTDTFTPDATPF
jgi:hypothetical protein